MTQVVLLTVCFICALASQSQEQILNLFGSNLFGLNPLANNKHVGFSLNANSQDQNFPKNKIQQADQDDSWFFPFFSVTSSKGKPVSTTTETTRTKKATSTTSVTTKTTVSTVTSKRTKTTEAGAGFHMSCNSDKTCASGFVCDEGICLVDYGYTCFDAFDCYGNSLCIDNICYLPGLGEPCVPISGSDYPTCKNGVCSPVTELCE